MASPNGTACMQSYCIRRASPRCWTVCQQWVAQQLMFVSIEAVHMRMPMATLAKQTTLLWRRLSRLHIHVGSVCI